LPEDALVARAPAADSVRVEIGHRIAVVVIDL
jgi:hypothetical protein